MSFVHVEPDPTRAPCLGCNERIAPRDLVRASHRWSSIYLWHPYHFWCVRSRAARPPSPLDRCADCGAALAHAAVRDAVRWAATFPRRLGRTRVHTASRSNERSEYAPGFVARPPGLWCVGFVVSPPAPAVVRVGGGAPAVPIFDGADAELEELVRGRFELVHDACADSDPWRARLRARGEDSALRVVYADRLELDGDLPRATFVRAELARRHDSANRALDAEIRKLRAQLPASWCRDVCLSRRTRRRDYGDARLGPA